MTHDYKRHGTTTLFAALDVLDGTVHRPLHGSATGIRSSSASSTPSSAEVPAGKPIHVILDNYATHKHPKVRAWLARHPRFTFHFTPTSASWLNAVEGFFAKLTRAPPQARRLPLRSSSSRPPSTASSPRPTCNPSPSSGPPTRQHHRRRQTRAPSVRFRSTSALIRSRS